MLERALPSLRILSMSLAALVLLQLTFLLVRRDPLAGLRIPATLKAPAVAPAADHSPDANSAAQAMPPASVSGPGLHAGRGAMGPAQAELPSGIRGRIDRITQSEILGPVMRPPPMALLGIAGQDVMLRGPNGQMKLLKEGEELDGVKLLQIGTNRVLIEHEGQKKELTIFSGFGSETLLPKGKENPQ